MANQFGRHGPRIINQAENIVKRLTLDVTSNLIVDTPVDTGWARANWVPSIGNSVNVPAGTRESVTVGDQQAGIATVAVTYTLSQGRVFITNNVPYIETLNEGSSRQAPAMFVQRAIQRGVRSLNIRSILG